MPVYPSATERCAPQSTGATTSSPLMSRRSSRASVCSSAASPSTVRSAVAGDLDLELIDGIESLLKNSLLRTERMSRGRAALRNAGDHARIRARASRRARRRRGRPPPPRRLLPPACRGGRAALLGPEQMRLARKLDSERDNLRAALTWAAESGETEVGLRTAGALWRFWQMRAADVEGREHLDRLLTSRLRLAVDPRHRAIAGRRPRLLPGRLRRRASLPRGRPPGLPRVGRRLQPVERPLGSHHDRARRR